VSTINTRQQPLAHTGTPVPELISAFRAKRRRTGVNVCPEAWYLQRFRHSPDADALQRLRDGMRRHQRIGRTTEQLVGTDAVRRELLVIVVALAALLLATSMGWLNLPGRPW
jgi:hypothetical protein